MKMQKTKGVSPLCKLRDGSEEKVNKLRDASEEKMR